jgi:hypothetical protein
MKKMPLRVGLRDFILVRVIRRPIKNVEILALVVFCCFFNNGGNSSSIDFSIIGIRNRKNLLVRGANSQNSYCCRQGDSGKGFRITAAIAILAIGFRNPGVNRHGEILSIHRLNDS